MASMIFDKGHTCCFTGHRVILPEHQPDLPELLKWVIRQQIRDGYYYFLTGGALGLDTLAADAVLEVRASFPLIQLYVIAPCGDQASRWSFSDNLHYERIHEASDDYCSLRAGYAPGCMRERNHFLVEQSTRCISYCLRDRSGTGQTVSYAKRQGLEIVDLVSIWNKKHARVHPKGYPSSEHHPSSSVLLR